MREEYADLLSERKYSVQTLKVLQGKALEWIKRNGGVEPSVQAVLNKLHKDMKDSANCKNQRSLFVNTCEKWYITGI